MTSSSARIWGCYSQRRACNCQRLPILWPFLCTAWGRREYVWGCFEDDDESIPSNARERVSYTTSYKRSLNSTLQSVFATFDSSVQGSGLEFIRFMVNNSVEWAQQGVYLIWSIEFHWFIHVERLGNLHYCACKKLPPCSLLMRKQPGQAILLANTILSPAAANESMEQLHQFMTETLSGTFMMTVEPNYETFYNNYIGAFIHTVSVHKYLLRFCLISHSQPVGVPLTPASRLIPVKTFSENPEQLISTLNNVQDVDIFFVFGTTPFLFGDNNRTSVTPAWRDSLWHVLKALSRSFFKS